MPSMRNRRDRDKVMNTLKSSLQELQTQHEELSHSVEYGRVRQQILEDSIRDLQHVAAFKQAMERALQLHPGHDDADAAAADRDAQQLEQLGLNSSSSGPSYVISLLHSVQPALVQQTLHWRAVDWQKCVNDAAFSICLLLQLSARGSSAPTPPSYNAVAEQELFKAVDDIVLLGALGTIFVQVTGKELGVCTSLNHITGQQEAPPDDHWQQVLQQLDLSRPQLLRLAACYQEFVRQRRTQQQLHADLAKAVACKSSCSLQLAAACAELASAASASSDPGCTASCDHGGDAADMHTAEQAEMSQPASLEDLLAEGEQQRSTAPPDPAVLMTRLLVNVHQSLTMPFLVLHNTLSRKQIACMLVASYPFVPRPGPVMEAAAQVVNAQRERGDSPASVGDGGT